MALFLRLVLAHFVADFVLQPDEVFEARKKGFRGAAIHYVVVFFTFFVFALPYLKFWGCWLIIFLASITHAIQDELKLRYIVNKKLTFIIFIFDQIFHILFISFIFLFKFAAEKIPVVNKLTQVYSNDHFVVLGIAYIVSIFMGAYLKDAFKTAYLKNKQITNPIWVKYGMFERCLITTALANNYFLVVLAIPLLVRILTGRFFCLDFIFNLIYSSAIGLFLRNFLPIF